MLDRADEHTLFPALRPGQMGRPRRQEKALVLAVLEDVVGMFDRNAAGPLDGPGTSSSLPTRVAASSSTLPPAPHSAGVMRLGGGEDRSNFPLV